MHNKSKASKPSPLSLLISGASGRMGRSLLRLAHANPAFHLTGGVVRKPDPALATELGALAYGTESPLPLFAVAAASKPLSVSDIAIDFSQPQASMHLLKKAVATGTPLLIGTTGFTKKDEPALAKAAKEIPLMIAANTSLGIALLRKAIGDLAANLGADWDVEILDLHHRNKKDAPSGTALTLARAIAAGRGEKPQFITDRRGLRQAGAIGFAVMRGGDIVGEHRVIFAGPGERIELAHVASDRALFAQGALKAGAWLARQKPGLYGIEDMLIRGTANKPRQTRHQ